ncbi:MAG: RDD family protein [Vampirovibrio sp.]|nr:RDD family protein [Vampirovibrio sp.]
MDIRSIHRIQTVENMPLEIELAGIGPRVIAFIIDFTLMCLFLALVGFLGAPALKLISNSTNEVMQYVGLASFLIFFGYPFLTEWLWNGRTLGKFIAKIRVVRNNGQPLGFWEAFGRNLFRVLDVYLAGIGLLPMMLSKQEKRFGDYVAGTLVTSVQKIQKPTVKNLSLDELPEAEPSEPLSTTGLTRQMTLEEYELLQAFLSRRRGFFKENAESLHNDLRTYFQQRLHVSEEDSQDLLFLEKLCKQYQAETRQHNQ